MSQPPLPYEMPERDRTRSIWCVYLSSIGAIVGSSCITGSVMTLVALKLGAGEIYLGVLNFAFLGPLVFCLLTMTAIERVGKRRVLLIWYTVSQVFAIPLLLLPWLAGRWSAGGCLWLILISVFLHRAALGMGFSGWFPILQDIVPNKITGRFFANLRTTWQAAGLISMLLIAWYLGNDPQWYQFAWIFIIAFIALLFRTVMIAPMAEAPVDTLVDQPQKIAAIFKGFFTNKTRVRLIFYIISYFFCATMAEPFKIKLLKDLGYGDGFIVAANAMIGLGAIVSLRFWGKLADYYGNRSIFSISHVGMIAVTVPWLLVDKSAFGQWLVLSLYLAYSVFHSGNGIAQTRYILHSMPANQQNYINLLNMVTYLTWATAPLAAGVFLSAVKTFHFQHGAMDLNHYHLLFLISAALFIIPHSLRRSIRLKKDTPTADVITMVARPVFNMFGPFLHLTRKADSSDSSQKAE